MRQQPPVFEVAYRNRKRRIRVAFLIPADTPKLARQIAEEEKRDLAAYRHIGTN
jgi:hypothetical protein